MIVNLIAGKTTVGKVCIVTGASTGIGEAIVRELALIGYMKVVFCARRRAKLMELVSKYILIFLFRHFQRKSENKAMPIEH